MGGAGQVPPIQVRSQDGGWGGGRAGTPHPDQIQDGGRVGGGRYPHPGKIPGWGAGVGAGQAKGGAGFPHPGQIQDGGAGWGWYPLSRSDLRMGGSRVGGTPYWNSIACTCYTAGGMPLAFTQENFLLKLKFSQITCLE